VGITGIYKTTEKISRKGRRPHHWRKLKDGPAEVRSKLGKIVKRRGLIRDKRAGKLVVLLPWTLGGTKNVCQKNDYLPDRVNSDS